MEPFYIQKPTGGKKLRSRIQNIAALLKQPWAKNTHHVLDLRGLYLGLSKSDVRKLLYAHHKVAIKLGWKRLAVLVDGHSKGSIAGMIRLEYLTTDPQVEFFFDEQSAFAWLERSN